MTHPANKRRHHNDAARDMAKTKGGTSEREHTVRKSKYGKRLEEMRRRARDEEE